MTDAEKIRELRHAQGLSQTAFAAKIGVKTATVSAWEHGRIRLTPERLSQIGNVFGVVLVDVTYSDDAPIGEKIRALRITKGLSQSQFAKELMTTSATISRWEGGQDIPSQRMLARLEEWARVVLDSSVEQPSRKQSDFSSQFGRELTKLRKAAKLSQKSLAVEIGVDDTTISAWETGKSQPRKERIEALCRYFNVKKIPAP